MRLSARAVSTLLEATNVPYMNTIQHPSSMSYLMAFRNVPRLMFKLVQDHLQPEADNARPSPLEKLPRIQS